MRPLRALACAALLAALAGGCGGVSDGTPAACLNEGGTYLKALADAPGQVLLPDEVPISECLAENQQAGDLAAVGTAMVAAATTLNAEARSEPDGGAALRLGYLIGAAQRGADSTEGIHAELIRRLTVAARYSPGDRPLSAPFLRGYQRGFDAGHESG